MSMLFHKWDEVYDCKTPLYIMVDNDYKISDHKFIYDFQSLNVQTLSNIINNKMDFIDNLHPNVLLYFVYSRNKRDNKLENRIYLFKKNTFYFFSSKSWWDEIGNVINQDNDIWYDPFVFFHLKDMDQVIRYLKLKEIANESR
jgi:hypothetical protein